MKARNVLFVLLLLFMAVYYVARIVIGVTAIQNEQGFEREVSELAKDIVAGSFLGIGILGFALMPGVVLHRWWGFWGTVLLSAYTVAWDVWAAIWVQSSAAIGIVPAVIIGGYLAVTRRDYLVKGAASTSAPDQPHA